MSFWRIDKAPTSGRRNAPENRMNTGFSENTASHPMRGAGKR
jgi:hypothetical protein